jgi:chromosome segregation ATPase
MREQLQNERELRIRKQTQRDEKLAEIEAFNSHYIHFQTMVANYLSENKTRTKELTDKEAFLRQRIEFNEREKVRLRAELDELKKKFENMKHHAEEETKQLEKDIDLYKEENKKLHGEIEATTPGYEDLCKLHEHTVKDFEETKLFYISNNVISNMSLSLA